MNSSYGLSLIYTLTFLEALVLVQSLRKTPSRQFMGFSLEEGSARSGLRAYRLLLLVLVVMMASVAFTVINRNDLIPVCAGISLCLCVVAPGTFGVTAWLKLGTRKAVRPVALSLEPRRFRDYISWRVEVATLGMIAAGWWLLLRTHGIHQDWRFLLQMTWGALVLPGKLLLVRAAIPVPAEQADEHYRFRNAVRRNYIRIMDGWGISIAVALLAYALQHSLALRILPAWILLSMVGMLLIAYAQMLTARFRNYRLSSTVGRELPASANPASGFAGDSWTVRLGLNQAYLVWLVIWCAGGVILALNLLL